MSEEKNNVLKGTRAYLIGHMEFLNGEEWRNLVKQELGNRSIKFIDPYYKPFVGEISENEDARGELKRWRETEQYDLVAQRMKTIRGLDLRLCDLCDWFIAVIKPDVASWGSAEEITTVIRQKKPLFLVINDPNGKKACPLWLFGIMPHKYVYNNLEEAVTTIKGIDDGIVKMSSDRWKLLRDEWR